MKRVLFFVAAFLCTLSITWAIPADKVDLDDLLKDIKKFQNKTVEVKGVVASQGTMYTGKDKGYHYYMLNSAGASIQVRCPLAKSARPALNDKVTLVGKVTVTPYGTYLQEESFQVTGKVKVENKFLGMDEKQAKKLAQAMKVLNQLGKLKNLESQIRKALEGFGINPEELLQKNLPKIIKLLKEMGIEQEQIFMFLQRAQKVYMKVQKEMKELLKDYGPMLKKVQKELFKRLRKAMQDQMKGGPGFGKAEKKGFAKPDKKEIIPFKTPPKKVK